MANSIRDNEEVVILVMDHDLTAAGRQDLLNMIERMRYHLTRLMTEKVKPLCLPCQKCLACNQTRPEMCLNPQPT